MTKNAVMIRDTSHITRWFDTDLLFAMGTDHNLGP